MQRHEVTRDQHFLTDNSVITGLVSAALITPTDTVLEIGAGTGSITSALAATGCGVRAFEIDTGFQDILLPLVRAHKNITLHYADALGASWKGCNKIVANIPFSLAEPVLRKAIASGITMMALIVSDGLKENLLGETTIGLLAGLHYTVTAVRPIARSSFEPPPRTDCWIVAFTARGPANATETVLRAMITGTGKTKNALRRALALAGKTKNKARDIIGRLGLDEESLDKNVRLHTWRFYARVRKALAAQR